MAPTSGDDEDVMELVGLPVDDAEAEDDEVESTCVILDCSQVFD